MSRSITISNLLLGSVKKIKTDYVLRSMSADAIFYHSQAILIQTFPSDLFLDDALALSPNSSILLKYLPDQSGEVGQGISVMGSADLCEVEATQVSGDVFVVSACFIMASQIKEDIYTSPNRIVAEAGMKLSNGDAILSAKTGSFTLKYSQKKEAPVFQFMVPYQAFESIY